MPMLVAPLQQADDYFSRLAAFSFTLALPHRAIPTDYLSSTLCSYRSLAAQWRKLAVTSAGSSGFTDEAVTLDALRRLYLSLLHHRGDIGVINLGQE